MYTNTESKLKESTQLNYLNIYEVVEWIDVLLNEAFHFEERGQQLPFFLKCFTCKYFLNAVRTVNNSNILNKFGYQWCNV